MNDSCPSKKQNDRIGIYYPFRRRQKTCIFFAYVLFLTQQPITEHIKEVPYELFQFPVRNSIRTLVGRALAVALELIFKNKDLFLSEQVLFFCSAFYYAKFMQKIQAERQ